MIKDNIKSKKTGFISYAKEDFEEVKKICDSLKREGIEQWFDMENIFG